MRNSALFAEHALLTKRMVNRTEIGRDWVYLARAGGTTRTEVVRYLHTHTTGKFAMGHECFVFEKEADAIIYKLAYPG